MHFQRRSVRASGFLGALTAALLFASPLLAAPTETISLENLEAQISDAPEIQSKESSVEQELQALRGAQDKAGLSLFFNNSLGPAAIIVARSYDDHVLRYQQSLGLSVPLLGTNIEQQIAILGAAEQVQVARIALNEIHRQKIAALRKAYIQYWGDGDQAQVATRYVGASQSDLMTGRSFLKTGFFTSTDLLDIQASIQKIQFQFDSLSSLQRSQLALVGTALGFEQASFQPVTPDFFDGCVPDRAVALKSAYEVDPTLATIEAQTIELQQDLSKVRLSAVAASAYGAASTATDLNHQVSGYSFDAGLNFSVPTRGRDEERARRAEYNAELQALALSEKQRRVEIASALDAALDNVQSAQTILAQAREDQVARDQDLRTAKTAFEYIRQNPRGQFIDLHAKRGDLFVAQTAVSFDLQSLLLQATDLLFIAPAACGSSFQPIPKFEVPAKPHRPKKTRTPRAVSTPKPAAFAPPPENVPAPEPVRVAAAAPKAREDFEWDSNDARRNAEKQGVRFELALGIFEDPLLVSKADPRRSDGWISTGSVGGARLVVVHTDVKVTTGEGEARTRIHIISAQAADRSAPITYNHEGPG
jgi:uncharacterized DUF497 family protein/outer membrane protein TolC